MEFFFVFFSPNFDCILVPKSKLLFSIAAPARWTRWWPTCRRTTSTSKWPWPSSSAPKTFPFQVSKLKSVPVKRRRNVAFLLYLGMDKSGAPVCEFYVNSQCRRDTLCPFRHVRGDKTIVCKHWLRGLCKKGDQCEFLHEYDMSKMPECYFYSRFSKLHLQY